jgi:hypothetical protein
MGCLKLEHRKEIEILIISFSSNNEKKEFISGYKNASMRLSTLRYLQRDFRRKLLDDASDFIVLSLGFWAINKLINQVCFDIK